MRLKELSLVLLGLSLAVPALARAESATPEGKPPKPPAGQQQNPPAEGSKPAAKEGFRSAALQGFEAPPTVGDQNVRATKGASRGGGELVLLGPARSRFLGEAPLFQWKSEHEHGPFVFEVLDERKKLIVHQIVNHTFYAPRGEALFEPGKTYSWRVSYPSEDATVTSDTAVFVLVDAAEKKAIGEALPALHGSDSYDTLLARARLFREKRLWYDAVGAYSEIIDRFPDRQTPYLERGQIYNQIADTKPLAEADFAHSDTLAKN